MIIIDYDNYPVASEMLQIFSYCEILHTTVQSEVFFCVMDYGLGLC